MHLIAARTLQQYMARHPAARSGLANIAAIIKAARWRSMQEIVGCVPYASPIGDERVVFNIAGNRFRLVCRVTFCTADESGQERGGTVFVRWFGTHAEYDRTDVETV